jgi:structural maintenance of chromosome 4
VLENFKSYAGAQRVGPFHKSFSCVVGPNGSGKSNVIDAMLFVFGKRAKQLRLNKVAELIHNSDNHPDLQYAKVSVSFQEIVDTPSEDGEGFEYVPGTQLEVSRVAYRDSTSKYLVNGKGSNFTEVTKLLKAKGIDLDHNRFLILQGEVEQISMMKPKAADKGANDEGLLEYLEDIIGSNRHIEAIEEGAKKLEEVNESRAGLVRRLRVVEKDLEPLQAAKAEAEKYLDKEGELLTWRSTLYQLHSKGADAEAAKAKAVRDEVDAKVETERAKMAAYDAELAGMEKEYNAEAKEHTKIAAAMAKEKKNFEAFERKDVKIREDMKHLKAKKKKADDKLAAEAKKCDGLKADVEANEAEVPKLEAKAAELAAELETAQARVEEITEGVRGEVDALRAEMDAAQAKLAPYEAQLAEHTAAAKEAEAEAALVRQKQAAAAKAVEDAKTAREAAADKAEVTEAKLTAKKADLKKQIKEVAKIQAQIDGARGAEEKAEAKLAGASGRAAEAKSRAGAAKSEGAVIKAIMQAKASGAIKGIHGRLGDLGGIDAKYDVAVTTACPALNYIVVETTAAAQRCVDLLRRNKLGVATFLILEKQEGLKKQMAAGATPPEGTARLFDLVTVKDERLRVAFYYALRDTVVAGDLDQGSRIAYGADRRFRRVVTLQGHMFEASGTMAGGGKTVRRGGMGQHATVGGGSSSDGGDPEAERQAAERELAEADAAAKAARAQLKEATKALAGAEKAVTALEREIPKLELDLSALQESVVELDARIAKLEGEAALGKEDAVALKALDKAAAAAKKAAAEVEKAAAGLKGEAAVLKARLDNVGGAPMAKARKAVASTKEGIEAAEGEAMKRRVAMETAVKRLPKGEKAVVKLEKEVAALGEEMEQLKADFKRMEDEAAAVLDEFQKTQAVLEEKEATVSKIRAAFEARQEEVSKARSAEVDLAAQAEEAAAAHKTAAEKQAHWAKELESARWQRAAVAAQAGGGEAPAAGAQLELPALLDDEALGEADEEKAQYQITLLEAELGELRPDMGAVREYREKEAEYQARVAELEQATGERDALRKSHDALRKARLDEFMSGFHTISLKLKEMYQMITLGGDAELELVDSLDPFSEGIVFSVRPPKKSWKNIANLSGGEKTLSSLALIFALHHYRPTPLYVMDEIDAALDFKNVSIVAHYLKERTKGAQFLVISLRNNMFELADRLVGIYKTHNATKSVTVNPHAFALRDANGQRQATTGISV